MSVAAQQILLAIGWSVLATILAQLISILFMRWLGLPVKKLVHEIENVQNAAVGAIFFVVSLTVALFVGIFASDGFTPVGERLAEGVGMTDTQTFLAQAGWIAMALFLSLLLTWVSFMIAYRMMGVENNESLKRYIQREIVEEQNASLALFLGGLMIAPFIAVIFQII
jgi:uncharacterized membrane protein YjfL (UPF0719 family)